MFPQIGGKYRDAHLYFILQMAVW